MITKKVYADRVRIKNKRIGNMYVNCIVTKYLLFGFIPVYIKYVEM